HASRSTCHDDGLISYELVGGRWWHAFGPLSSVQWSLPVNESMIPSPLLSSPYRDGMLQSRYAGAVGGGAGAGGVSGGSAGSPGSAHARRAVAGTNESTTKRTTSRRFISPPLFREPAEHQGSALASPSTSLGRGHW